MSERVAIVVGAGGELVYLLSDAAAPVSGAIVPAYSA